MTLLNTTVSAAAALLLSAGAAFAGGHEHKEPKVIGPYTYSQYEPVRVLCPKNTTVAREHGVLYCVPNTAWAKTVCPKKH